jgi:hypothetical protein
MKVDLDYMKEIFSVFIGSDNAHVTLHDLAADNLPLTDENGKANQKLLFHLQIFLDNYFIGTSTDNTAHNLKDIGISGTDTDLSCSIRELRLTHHGHDFANTLQNKAVFERLKSEFKDAPFNVIFDGGQKLIQHYFKKKLDILLEE